MLTVKEPFFNKYEVKKSTFTSYLIPYSDFHHYHDRLKQEHPKANHIVFAYRMLNEHNQIQERASDDGEPKGVAGTPTLNVLRGKALINSAILTVRYFGGTKLGTGGMVRAYTQSAKEVIAQSKLIPYMTKQSITFTTPYTLTKRYEHYFNTQNISYHDRTFGLDSVTWQIALSEIEKKYFEIFIKSL